MISTLNRVTVLYCALVAALFAVAVPAFAQAPTDAQRSAIRSACRSDYQAHCASVPPGGMASLQCLQQNMSSLSPSCQTAVRAVEPPAAPKAETAPVQEPAKETAKETAKESPKETAKETGKETGKETVKENAAQPARPAAETAAPAPKVATAPAAKKPSSAQVAAIRSACRSDFMKSCSGVPAGGAEALGCLEKNKSKLSPSCEQAVNAAGGAKPPAASGGSSTATAPATAPADAPAPAPALVLRPMLPREELFVLRSACGEDVRALCSGVMIGGGRVVRCLASQAAALSPACRGVLGQFAAQ